ncbi:DUF2141 domain-containing protein [Sphingobium sp. AN641]|uniref:DUF2141 domain-containing protein n=1 Tax=Sphingobium sp. AN641 TaxID=3133443 RepID=UPI0030C472B7
MLKVAFGVLTAGALVASVPAWSRQHEIGNDLSRCAASAEGPAILVDVKGFASATGNIRVQSYPAVKDAWLTKGAWLNRIDSAVKPMSGAMRFCLPVPEPGRYGIAVRHDRNGNGKTDLSLDGGGFSNNPSINIFNLGKPSVEKSAVRVGPGVTRITINLRYM